MNEERSNAGGHWHPFAGTLACQVVGFTLEPLGLCSEKTQMAWGVLQLAAVGVPLSGPLERGKGWMNGGKTRGIRRGGQRESSKWFQGAGPTCRKRWVSGRMLLCTEGAWKGSTNWFSSAHRVESSSWYFAAFVTDNVYFKATASSSIRKKRGGLCYLNMGTSEEVKSRHLMGL